MVTEIQDDKGRFVKGHPFLRSRRGLKNGRPKTLAGEVRDALALAEDAMPEIILSMIERATNPLDRDCQRASEYLCDRIYGKSNQPLSNKDGTNLPTFAFIVPAGYTPKAGGLFSQEPQENKN